MVTIEKDRIRKLIAVPKSQIYLCNVIGQYECLFIVRLPKTNLKIHAYFTTSFFHIQNNLVYLFLKITVLEIVNIERNIKNVYLFMSHNSFLITLFNGE